MSWRHACPSSPASTRRPCQQPREIIDRPRTLPGAELELNAGVDLQYTSVTVNDMTTTSTVLRAPLVLGYGLSNDLDLHVLYGVLLHPDLTGKQPLDIRLGYTFLRDGP